MAEPFDEEPIQRNVDDVADDDKTTDILGGGRIVPRPIGLDLPDLDEGIPPAVLFPVHADDNMPSVGYPDPFDVDAESGTIPVLRFKSRITSRTKESDDTATYDFESVEWHGELGLFGQWSDEGVASYAGPMRSAFMGRAQENNRSALVPVGTIVEMEVRQFGSAFQAMFDHDKRLPVRVTLSEDDPTNSDKQRLKWIEQVWNNTTKEWEDRADGGELTDESTYYAYTCLPKDGSLKDSCGTLSWHRDSVGSATPFSDEGSRFVVLFSGAVGAGVLFPVKVAVATTQSKNMKYESLSTACAPTTPCGDVDTISESSVDYPSSYYAWDLCEQTPENDNRLANGIAIAPRSGRHSGMTAFLDATTGGVGIWNSAGSGFIMTWDTKHPGNAPSTVNAIFGVGLAYYDCNGDLQLWSIDREIALEVAWGTTGKVDVVYKVELCEDDCLYYHSKFLFFEKGLSVASTHQGNPLDEKTCPA